MEGRALPPSPPHLPVGEPLRQDLFAEVPHHVFKALGPLRGVGRQERPEEASLHAGRHRLLKQAFVVVCYEVYDPVAHAAPARGVDRMPVVGWRGLRVAGSGGGWRLLGPAPAAVLAAPAGPRLGPRPPGRGRGLELQQRQERQVRRLSLERSRGAPLLRRGKGQEATLPVPVHPVTDRGSYAFPWVASALLLPLPRDFAFWQESVSWPLHVPLGSRPPPRQIRAQRPGLSPTFDAVSCTCLIEPSAPLPCYPGIRARRPRESADAPAPSAGLEVVAPAS